MKRWQRTWSLILVGMAISVFVARSFGEEADVDAERKLGQLRQQIEIAREKQRDHLRQQLGERLKPLLAYSTEELAFALEVTLKEKYEGASLLSAEDEPVYLGKITDSFDPESIFNSFGRFGNAFAANSIWNNFGRYGGSIPMHSPLNALSTRPPYIVKNNKIIGRLTTNKLVTGAVDPALLKLCFGA
jgi:hypothetical protein